MAKNKLEIYGTDWPYSLKRTLDSPLDASSVFNTYEEALQYAKNDDEDDYCPYAGQIISLSDGKAYILKDDKESVFNVKDEDRNHFKLTPIGEDSLIKDLEIKDESTEDTAVTNIGFEEGKLTITKGRKLLSDDEIKQIAADAANTKAEEVITKIVDDSPESFDTLKEFYTWIDNHGKEALKLSNDVSKNSEDIKTQGDMLSDTGDRLTALEGKEWQEKGDYITKETLVQNIKDNKEQIDYVEGEEYEATLNSLYNYLESLPLSSYIEYIDYTFPFILKYIDSDHYSEYEPGKMKFIIEQNYQESDTDVKETEYYYKSKEDKFNSIAMSLDTLLRRKAPFLVYDENHNSSVEGEPKSLKGLLLIEKNSTSWPRIDATKSQIVGHFKMVFEYVPFCKCDDTNSKPAEIESIPMETIDYILDYNAN